MPELWQPIKGYEGLYEVSDQGRVRSLDRTIPHGKSNRRLRGKFLRAGKASTGYLTVALCNGGIQITHQVHVLVAQAFVEHREEEKDWALHWNDIKTDNRASNLRWGTHQDNVKDCLRNGKTTRGTKHGSAIFTEAQVLSISQDARTELAIAKDYGVSRSAIANIKQGNNWGWLTKR